MNEADWEAAVRGDGESLRVLIAADDPGAQADAAHAVEITGGRVVARLSLDQLGQRLSEQAELDLIMVEFAGIASDRVDRTIDILLGSAHAPEIDGPNLIGVIDVGQIDATSARLHGGRVQLLCEPNLAERTAAIAQVRSQRGGARLNDLTRESEQERLRRLDEEVARIADALTRLTGRNPTVRDLAGVRPAGATLHERALHYEAPPATTPASTDIAAAARVRAILKARRMRDQYFDAMLFADPAWDMLLDLFAARLEHARVSVSSLCIASAVPPTTALRWISTLTEAGLIERESDPLDKRRAFLRLSDDASDALRGYLSALERVNASVI